MRFLEERKMVKRDCIVVLEKRLESDAGFKYLIWQYFDIGPCTMKVNTYKTSTLTPV